MAKRAQLITLSEFLCCPQITRLSAHVSVNVHAATSSANQIYQELYAHLLNVSDPKTGFELTLSYALTLFAQGVYSHGLNRFPRFMEMIQNGIIDIHARPDVASVHW